MENKKTNSPAVLENTKSLQEIILENPTLPLVIYCNEPKNFGEPKVRINVDDMALYFDKKAKLYYWLNKTDLKNELIQDFEDCKECKGMTFEEFDKFIQDKIDKTEFVKEIVVYVE